MESKPIILAGILASGLLALQPAQAGLTFQFNYINTGGSNLGFVDPTHGAARQTALQQSAALLGNYFSAYNATITFDVNSEDNPGSSTLASAGSGLGAVGLGNSVSTPFKHTVVQQKILHGTDANGSAADGEINWNFGIPDGWFLGDTPSGGAFDFKSTAMHELLHAMGFTSSVQAGGAGASGNPADGSTPDIWNTSDQFLTDNAGNFLINSGGLFDLAKVGVLTGGTTGPNDTPTGNGTFFNGANAVAGNGGSKVNIYSHQTFDSGSSIAHLDDAFFTSDALLMEAATVGGAGTRTLSNLEIGYLKDIGYTQIAAVPVPAAVWLMGSGLMALFGITRRRKLATA